MGTREREGEDGVGDDDWGSFGLVTLIDLLRERGARHSDRCAFLADGEREQAPLTYAQLDCRAHAIAAWLQRHGARDERALLFQPPGLAFVAAARRAPDAGERR